MRTTGIEKDLPKDRHLGKHIFSRIKNVYVRETEYVILRRRERERVYVNLRREREKTKRWIFACLVK